MKPHSSILVVLRWFDNPKELNNGDLLVGIVLEFSSWLTV
jgi:hypothetical protein